MTIKSVQGWIISFVYTGDSADEEQARGRSAMKEHIVVSKTSDGKPDKIYSQYGTGRYISSLMSWELKEGKLEDLKAFLDSDGHTNRHNSMSDTELRYPLTEIDTVLDKVCCAFILRLSRL